MVLNQLKNQISPILQFLGFFIIILYIFCLIGVNIFYGELQVNQNNKIDLLTGKIAFINYDNWAFGLFSTFVLIIGDNWTDFDYYMR